MDTSNIRIGDEITVKLIVIQNHSARQVEAQGQGVSWSNTISRDVIVSFSRPKVKVGGSVKDGHGRLCKVECVVGDFAFVSYQDSSIAPSSWHVSGLSPVAFGVAK